MCVCVCVCCGPRPLLPPKALSIRKAQLVHPSGEACARLRVDLLGPAAGETFNRSLHSSPNAQPVPGDGHTDAGWEET